jgi:hypothetical protein
MKEALDADHFEDLPGKWQVLEGVRLEQCTVELKVLWVAHPRAAAQRRSMDQRLYVRFPPGTAGSPTPAYGCHHDLGCGG